MSKVTQKSLTVAHSPDSDDAFMFHALANNKIDTEGLEIRHELCDIETLNKRALAAELEVTAISFHAYPYVADKYIITRAGASMGDRYGPVIVSAQPLNPGELKGLRIASPGKLTSAELALRLYEPEVEPVHMDFNAVQDAVKSGDVDAGVIIHEGQVTYNEMGLYKVVDLGEWWWGQTQLPLPLGCNIALRSLGLDVIQAFNRSFERSIRYALENKEEALDYALSYGRGLSRERAEKFVHMYVNPYTIDIGDKGVKAVQEFLKRGHEAGIIETPPKPEWA